MDADGQNQTNLTTNGANDKEPYWGPALVAPPTIADLIDSVDALGPPTGLERTCWKKLTGAQRNLDQDHLSPCLREAPSFTTRSGPRAARRSPPPTPRG